jgi:hypothetical protein
VPERLRVLVSGASKVADVRYFVLGIVALCLCLVQWLFVDVRGDILVDLHSWMFKLGTRYGLCL